MRKLANQGHELHVVYMVSGNLAVFDFDALRFADFVRETHAITNGEGLQLYERVV